MGLETEYALHHEPDPGKKRLDPVKLYDWVEKEVLDRFRFVRGFDVETGGFAIREGFFLENGARFYYDTGHPEWSSPETTDPLILAAADQAADRALALAVRESENALRDAGIGGRVLLLKNSVDPLGSTWGSHENYWLSDLLSPAQKAILATFLVTRQIFTGAGRIGAAPQSLADSQPVPYQISQRPDLIMQLSADFSNRDPKCRSIVDTRDEPHAGTGKRLHIICGDHTLSPWTTELRFGTAAIFLNRMMSGVLVDPPIAKDPIRAFRDISRDPDMQAPIELTDGGTGTALDIQEEILNRVLSHRLGDDRPVWWSRVLERWGWAIDAARGLGWPGLSKRIDWAAKRLLIERFWERSATDPDRFQTYLDAIIRVFPFHESSPENEKPDEILKRKMNAVEWAHVRAFLDNNGLSWSELFDYVELYADATAIDVGYHLLQADTDGFARMAELGLTDPFPWEGNPPEDFTHNPPRDTRAYIRSRFIREAHETDIRVRMDWDRVEAGGVVVKLSDPSATDTRIVEQTLERARKGIDFSFE